jgi:hypothetical protein
MSTIPLSARDIDAPEGTSHYGPMAPEDRVDAGSSARLDAHIAKSIDATPEFQEVPQERDLDKLIGKNLDKYYEAKSEEESFAASRESRSELQERYAAYGGDLSKTLDTFIDVARQFKADPQGTGLRFAESYLRASPYALKPRGEKAAKPEAEIIDGKRYSGKVLDAVISDAIDNASQEKKDFEATPAQRAALKELFPGKTFAEALATVAKIDRDAHIDPLTTAATIAAQFGMPVTPGQQQTHAERVQADAEIAHAAQRLPHVDQVRVRMADIIQNDPRFQQAFQAGVNQQDILTAAHEVAVQQHNEAVAFDRWAVAQLQAIEKSDPALAVEACHVFGGQDAAFNQRAAQLGPVERMHSAISWAAAKAQANTQAVAKAKKVGRPVKSSSGAIPGGKGGGLDGAIAAAMNKHW